METKLIDGKAIAKAVRREAAQEAAQIKETYGRAPKLAVILVGDDPASHTYVSSKEKACAGCGIESETLRFPGNISQETLLEAIEKLNADETVSGILVQLPLPKGLDADAAIRAIAPEKDVDGLHVLNIGRLAQGTERGLRPCTPSGVMELLERSGMEISGKRCVVVGRSNLVGKPAALLLLEANATVTMCHSRTQNLASHLREADIVVVAVGKPKMITGDMIKEGAVVIDVGIHRTPDGLCGDVDTESCMGIAGAITPVPGGVGPMTVAMLMKNCVEAEKARRQC